MKKLFLACAIAIVLVFSFGVVAMANTDLPVGNGVELRVRTTQGPNRVYVYVGETRVHNQGLGNNEDTAVTWGGNTVTVRLRGGVLQPVGGITGNPLFTATGPLFPQTQQPQCQNVVVARQTVVTKTVTGATAAGNAVRRPQGNVNDINVTVTATVVTTTVVYEKFCDDSVNENPALGSKVPTTEVSSRTVLSVPHSDLRNQAVNNFNVTVGEFVNFPIGIHRHGNTLTVQNAVINVTGMTTTTGEGVWVPTGNTCPAHPAP